MVPPLRRNNHRDTANVPSTSAALRATTDDTLLAERGRQAAPSPRDLKVQARRLAVHCAAYRGAIPHRALTQFVMTLVTFVALIAAMFIAVEHYYWLTLVLALPAGGLLVRLFIIQHDCGHGSFLKRRASNDLVGRLCSVLTLTPYRVWAYEHAKHHASSGNLEERGVGDIDTLTVSEYTALSPWRKAWYRLYRNPLFLFGFAVPFYFVFMQRLPHIHPLPRRGEAWSSVFALDAAIVVVYGTLGYFLGFWHLFLVVAPVVHLASAAGGWLFFVQHQYEDTHWNRPPDWDQQVAALFGSSYYVLPPVLNWFTGNIGLHHIHHLNSMIPNYRLQDCLKASPELQSLGRLTLWQSLACVRYKLWCEETKRMVSFREASVAA